MNILTMRKALISEFSKELAELQRKADVWFYERDNQEMADHLLIKAEAIKSLADRLGICKEVYQEAYKIYDFRNSGRKGYTLACGQIVALSGEFGKSYRD